MAGVGTQAKSANSYARGKTERDMTDPQQTTDSNETKPTIGIAELAEASTNVAATRARLKKVSILSESLQRVTTAELPIAVKFLAGELTQGKIGIGGASVHKTLGAAAERVDANSDGGGTGHDNRAHDVSLTQVDAVFGEIARCRGKGSGARRKELLLGLLESLPPRDREFVVRLVLGDLRHGALEGIMVEAVAKATGTALSDVRRATMLTGDLSEVAAAATTEGLEGLKKFSLQLFRPVQPMLAEPTHDMASAMQRLGEAALEYKLDGVRVQVHQDANDVRVFTRHLKDVTHSVPELVERVRELKMRQAILDGEVLALRPDGRPHPFQTTMRRFGRSREVAKMRETLPLSVLFFDCLLLDHQSLIDQPTKERQLAIGDCLPRDLLVPRLITSDLTKATEFLAQAIEAGHEGVMAKSLDANYAAGGRGQSWLKIKPTHNLDLVILAAEWGSGRRQGWLSNLHLGARDPISGEFAMIGKTFKGLTDAMLDWQTEVLLALETSRDEYTVFVQPRLVAEVAFNEVQRSPRYDSGYALRFARIKRYREDKSPAEADTIGSVVSIFERQRR